MRLTERKGTRPKQDLETLSENSKSNQGLLDIKPKKMRKDKGTSEWESESYMEPCLEEC